MAADSPPILRLTIDTAHPVMARQAGEIFARLAMSFDQYQRQNVAGTANRTTLRLDQLRTGSLIADMVALADAMFTLYETREILGGFIAQLSDALTVMRGIAEGIATPSDRKTIATLAAPVANDNARQVCLQVIGDNNTVLIIDNSAVLDIAAEDSSHKVGVTDVRPPSSRRSVLFRGFENPLQQDTGPGGIFIHPDLKHATVERAQHDLGSRTHTGTANWVLDDWYVQLDEGVSVLLPIDPTDSDAFGFDPNCTYRVQGKIVFADPYQPSGFHVTDATER
jgi:hypothetical protein